MPAGDADCDGFTASQEAFVGTVATQHCAATSTANDEGLPDAWPVDLNDDQTVTMADVTPLILAYNSVAPGPPYSVRYDLNGDGHITMADIANVTLFYNKTCAP